MATKDDPKKTAPLAPQARPQPRRDAASSEAFEKEVDEELQRERMNRLWETYRVHILAAAAAIVLAVGGYKWFEGRRIAAAEARGERLASAVKLLRENKTEDALAKLGAIAKDGGAAGALANLRLAAKLADDGKATEAVAAYEAVTRDRTLDPLLTEYAQLQTAMLKLDSGDWTDLQNRLTPLTSDASAWRHSARELLGLAAMKANRADDARKQFESLLADRLTPQGIAERARIAMATLTATELAKAAPAETKVEAKPDTPAAKTEPPAKSAPDKAAPAPTKK